MCLLLDLSHRLEKHLALCRMCHHQWISAGARWWPLFIWLRCSSPGCQQPAQCARLRDNSEVAFETISRPGVHPYPSCPSGGSLRSAPQLPTRVGKKEINYTHTHKCLSDLARKWKKHLGISCVCHSIWPHYLRILFPLRVLIQSYFEILTNSSESKWRKKCKQTCLKSSYRRESLEDTQQKLWEAKLMYFTSKQL